MYKSLTLIYILVRAKLVVTPEYDASSYDVCIINGNQGNRMTESLVQDAKRSSKMLISLYLDAGFFIDFVALSVVEWNYNVNIPCHHFKYNYCSLEI